MLPTAKDWLQHLKAEARNARLDHLDLLIDCAALPGTQLTTLLELTPAPACAWLFEQTPEQELAHLGPLLLRIDLTSQEQSAGLAVLLDATYRRFCVLALISRWPFEDLAAHLRGATQASWNKDTRNGVLRYYDTRLFKPFCEQLDPHQLRIFHAPVIQWHWIDQDSKAAALSGFDTRPNAQAALSGISISDDQIQHLQALSTAIEWLKVYDKAPYEHGFTSREAMLRCVSAIHLDIHRQKLDKHEHDHFIATALSQHLPISHTWSKTDS